MPHRKSCALVAALGLASVVVTVGLPSFALPRRGATLALGGLGAMGWAGYLGSELDVNVKGDAAVQLGLGAREIEDATGWELLFFKNTLEDLNGRCPKNSQVLYHYTDLPSAKAIVGGRQGLRLSRGGYKGGGVFFSTRAPVEKLDPAESNRWPRCTCGVVVWVHRGP